MPGPGGRRLEGMVCGYGERDVLPRKLMMILNSVSTRYVFVCCAGAIGACLVIRATGCNKRKEADSVAAEPQIPAAESETASAEPEMVIDRLVLGRLQTNCYCLRASKAATQCLIIDTGADGIEPLTDFLKENTLTPAAAIFTHGHHDHINGAALLRENFAEIRFVIHKDDAKALRELAGDLKAAPIEMDGPIEFAGIKLEVLHTPGHTPGGICLYSKSRGAVFTGDTLFAGATGRTDSRGGTDQLMQGIKDKLLVLPDEVVVFPGHGPSTTIARERRLNQFM